MISTASVCRPGAQPPQTGVPAVNHTVAILRYLQSVDNQPTPMADIARALEMNPSTCFNILKTLAASHLLAYDEDTRRYSLGMALIEFAELVDSHGRLLASAQQHASEIAREISQICVIFRKTEDAFLVVSKGEGRRAMRLTASLGERFPPNGAVLAKSWYAWASDDEVDRLIELHGLPMRTTSSITGMRDFREEIRRTRERGFALSVGEYYEEHNAVGRAVLGPDGHSALLLVVTGFGSALPREKLPEIGRLLLEHAEQITAEVFGSADAPAHPEIRTP